MRATQSEGVRAVGRSPEGGDILWKRKEEGAVLDGVEVAEAQREEAIWRSSRAPSLQSRRSDWNARMRHTSSCAASSAASAAVCFSSMTAFVPCKI